MKDIYFSQSPVEDLSPEDFPCLIRQYLNCYQPGNSYDTAIIGMVFIFVFSCMIDMEVCLKPKGKMLHLNISLLYILARKDNAELMLSHLVLLNKLYERGRLAAKNFDIYFKRCSEMKRNGLDLQEKRFLDYFKPFHIKDLVPKSLTMAPSNDLLINELSEILERDHSDYPMLCFNLGQYSGAVKKLNTEKQEFFVDRLCDLVDFLLEKNQSPYDGINCIDMIFADCSLGLGRSGANSLFYFYDNEADLNIIRMASYLALIDFRCYISEKDIKLSRVIYEISFCSNHNVSLQKASNLNRLGMSPAEVLGAIRKICGEKGCCTTKDIYRFFCGHIKQRDLHYALDLLSIKKFGLIEKKIKKSGKGRPATLYSAIEVNSCKL